MKQRKEMESTGLMLGLKRRFELDGRCLYAAVRLLFKSGATSMLYRVHETSRQRLIVEFSLFRLVVDGVPDWMLFTWEWLVQRGDTPATSTGSC